MTMEPIEVRNLSRISIITLSKIPPTSKNAERTCFLRKSLFNTKRFSKLNFYKLTDRKIIPNILIISIILIKFDIMHVYPAIATKYSNFFLRLE